MKLLAMHSTLIYLLLIASSCLAQNNKLENQPSIKYKEGKYILNLPSKMKSALSKYNASFVHWNTKDYTPKILTNLKKDSGASSAPFALVVDVNKNGKLDVIIDGHDSTKALLICILSKGENYNVLLIDEHPLYHPSEIENYNDGKKEYGLNYYMRANRQNKENGTAIFTIAIPQQSDAAGALLKDGIMIDYYFKNGKFEAEKQIL